MMDMIGLGRQAFADPFTPRRLMEDREDGIHDRAQYMNCEEWMSRRQPVGCVLSNRPTPSDSKRYAGQWASLPNFIPDEEIRVMKR